MIFERTRRLLSRHRSIATDLVLILLGLGVALYVAYAVNIFEDPAPLSRHEREIELDEALLISSLLMVALLLFGIKHFLAGKREIARRTAAEHRIRELAYQDGLTGLPNRRRFDDALKAAVAALPRAGAAHAVFLLDLNGFKKINDTFGHGTGDETLVVVAQRLLSAMREGDMVARFGGDEFAILATHLADVESATNIALRVIAALETPIATGAGLHYVGVGIGIALVPTDAQTVSEALRKADIALYRAKAERRSALHFFAQEMDASVRDRSEIESALRQALEQDRIATVFRPIVHLKTHEITGYEAMPEWTDPTHGSIPRERFMAIADEAGLLHEITDRTLRFACQAAAAWPSRVGLSMDVYPSQLKDRGLPKRLMAELTQAGLPPQRLELQITESALVADIEGAQAVLSPLRERGVRIALDNFGTGYSSLYHLRNFKVDKVKIDRSFIRNLASDDESTGIVAALIGLGQGFGLQVAADGIDAQALDNALAGAGCEEGQGKLFGISVDAAQAAQWVAEGAAPGAALGMGAPSA